MTGVIFIVHMDTRETFICSFVEINPISATYCTRLIIYYSLDMDPTTR